MEELLSFNSNTPQLLSHILSAIVLTFLLSLAITWVYKKTYRGLRYSQSFVHTVIIMSVVVAIVMAVIGDNLAVAFGLVGAFSIIRFRSAMSAPKDIAYIFFGMAVGVATGLQQYAAAITLTVVLSALIFFITRINYGAREAASVLRVVVPENLHYDNMFDDIFSQHLDNWSLQSMETTNLGTMVELQFKISVKPGGSYKNIIDPIREKNANLKVAITLAQ